MKYVLHPHHTVRLYRGGSWGDSFDVQSEDGQFIYSLLYTGHNDYSISGPNGKEIALFKTRAMKADEIYRLGQFYASISHKCFLSSVYTMEEKGLILKTHYLEYETPLLKGDRPVAYLRRKWLADGPVTKHGWTIQTYVNGFSDDPELNDIHIETEPEYLFDAVIFGLEVYYYIYIHPEDDD